MITDMKRLENHIKAGNYETLYWDLDGCLANFNLEYYLRTGEKPEDDPAKVWDKFIGWVDRGFFCTLLPIRSAINLVYRLQREGYDTRILTAVGSRYNREYEDIIEQKKYWCNKYLKDIPLLFVEKGTDKGVFVKNGKKSLLIDDQRRNVDNFISCKGSAIQYVPDYDYPEENPTADLEEEIRDLHEALDTAELEIAELKNPITKEEKLRGIISDLEDRQWKQYCRDERVF